jgi:hypothetical protein
MCQLKGRGKRRGENGFCTFCPICCQDLTPCPLSHKARGVKMYFDLIVHIRKNHVYQDNQINHSSEMFAKAIWKIETICCRTIYKINQYSLFVFLFWILDSGS